MHFIKHFEIDSAKYQGLGISPLAKIMNNLETRQKTPLVPSLVSKRCTDFPKKYMMVNFSYLLIFCYEGKELENSFLVLLTSFLVLLTLTACRKANLLLFKEINTEANKMC